MADKNCEKCKGTGWRTDLRWSEHGCFREEFRCQCNPPQWLTVLDIAIARRVFWEERADDDRMEQFDSILDDLMLNLTRETEDKLKKLLT